jgi:hypothetical protein
MVCDQVPSLRKVRITLNDEIFEDLAVVISILLF